MKEWADYFDSRWKNPSTIIHLVIDDFDNEPVDAFSIPIKWIMP